MSKPNNTHTAARHSGPAVTARPRAKRMVRARSVGLSDVDLARKSAKPRTGSY